MRDARSLLKTSRPLAGAALPLALALRVLQGLMALAMAFVLSGLVDALVFRHLAPGELALPMALLAAFALLRAGCSFLAETLAARAANRVRADLFRRLLDHLARLGPVRLSGLAPGEIATIVIETLEATGAYWRKWLPAMALCGVVPPVILLLVVPFDRITALIFLVTVPLMILFMVLAGTGAERASERQYASLARLGGHVLESIRGLVDLKLLRAEQRTLKEVARKAEDYRRETMAVLRIAFLSALALEFFATLSIALIAVLVGFRLMWGGMDFRTGFFLLLLAPEFYLPLRLIGTQRHAKMQAEAAAAKIAEFLALKAPEAIAPPAQAAFSEIGLRFDEVGVVHEDGRRALADISFSVRAGEHVALVGESGAGKSTLLALLAGFIAPTEGRILINGEPLERLDTAVWRRHLALLPQHPHLFAGDIAENLCLGRAASREAIKEALKEAEALDFVEALPEGLATRLGERGLGLSGGQAQRLALARAFLFPAPLILCDEPTAHLDAGTEQKIAAATARLARGRTLITIAHRLKTITAADRILVLSGGALVEEGTHESLKAAGGAYARLLCAAEGGVLA